MEIDGKTGSRRLLLLGTKRFWEQTVRLPLASHPVVVSCSRAPFSCCSPRNALRPARGHTIERCGLTYTWFVHIRFHPSPPPHDRGSSCETQPAGTIASQLRIQSILSPPDPSDADETSTGSTNTPKRKFQDAFSATSATADAAPPPERPRQPLPHSSPLTAAVRGQGQAQPADDDIKPPPGVTMMGGSPDSPGTADSKKGAKRTPLRSSIACQRCRKSKIKCNNTGGDAPCETCIRNGKECTYPEVTPVPPKRPDPPTGIKHEQGSDRKRVRRIDDISKLEGAMPPAVLAEEVLSAPYLSETIWSQVFDIYRLHFATELPFLHLATLKEKMGSKFRAKQNDTSPEINLVLLGILTLTARFHSTLVSYVTAPGVAGAIKARPPGSSGQDASAASEYYAEVLTKALGGLRTSMTVASVERVQAFLMLGLYEWSQTRPKIGGMAAWMYVGVAIRMAQALGLGDGDKDPGKNFRNPVFKTTANMPQSQMMIAKEIRRRTMFSCLILDRLLGCGKGRVSTIRAEDLQIQLPCSEVAFDLSEDVYTGFLKPMKTVRVNGPINDSVLSRFVRLIDIWGEISKWSFAGGRFTESYAPWSEKSTFYQLRQRLDSFYGDLPELFQWSSSNYYKHENHQASSVYVSLHMLGAVCRIMLHREYIPFIPIKCEKPAGPLDEPTFTAGDEPDGFWDESAEQVFLAAKDIVDLIDICRDKLPMSALVLFTVWTAAFVGIYAVYFPQMDVRRHMLPLDEEAAHEMNVSKSGPTGLTYKTLKQMSVWLKMAETYAAYFRDMVGYYDKVKQDWEKVTGKKQYSSQAEERLSLRLGGAGGLEEWKQHNPKIVNNGEILAVDDDRHSSSRDSTIEPGSSVGPDSNYYTEHTKTPRSTSLSFTPINSGGGAQQQQQQHGQESADQTFRMDGLPNADQWRFHPPVVPLSQQQQQQQHSPSQSSYAMPSPQMAQTPIATSSGADTSGSGPQLTSIATVPLYQTQTDVDEYVDQNQSLPWFLVPGGIDQFAHGNENFCLMDNGNGFWGAMPEVGIVQQVGSYT
ncbi:fungal-specific transcription factor domain-containing protein [Apodospora peruviana]|uniref:Fungal-specific transcription factor domain-containing protein n=1 Tax=Apodospora peruviana TaxID=516989 RepID=A0AAE0I811_9PEZI|nr:fungal-specific transcription factor domain-containing protein [Apodospora peruviana]